MRASFGESLTARFRYLSAVSKLLVLKKEKAVVVQILRIVFVSTHRSIKRP